MTAAHRTSSSSSSSSLPVGASDDLHHGHLLHRLEAMSTTATAHDRDCPTTTKTTSTTLGPRLLAHSSALTSRQVAEEHSSAPSTFPPYPPKPAASRVSSSCLPEDTVDMGDSSTLSRQSSNASDDSTTSPSRRPSTPRSQTAPSLDTMNTTSTTAANPNTNTSTNTNTNTNTNINTTTTTTTTTRTQLARNPAPYARAHLRTQSTSALQGAPPMTRAHSLPTVMHPIGNLTLSPTPAPLARPASPLRSPKRTRSPRDIDSRAMPASPHERYGSALRPASIGSFEGAPSVCDISEDAELELTPRAASGLSSLYSSTGSLSRRRRPASPLYQVAVSFGGHSSNTSSASTPTSTTSSPLLAPSKFNEQYPPSLASSSVPSTPTSMRSRSPSISSLETIEDSPDAEEEAIEADRIARLKAAADREDGEEQRRSSLDQPEGRGRSLGFGKRDSRKRWSVCGAERRQDLDLETIWED